MKHLSLVKVLNDSINKNCTTTNHKEGEQQGDQRNIGESSCNFGDRTDQRFQSLMFMMMMNKSKFHSRTGHEDAVGEQMYRAGGQPHVPAALPLGKRLGTLCAGGWVDARVVLDECRKADSHWNSIPKQCSPQQVATLTTVSRPTLNDSVSRYFITQDKFILTFQGTVPTPSTGCLNQFEVAADTGSTFI